MKRRHLFLFVGIVVFFVMIIYAFRGKGRTLSTNEEEVFVVQRGEVVARAAETGSLEPANTVEIKSEQSGEIRKLLVRAGDKVRAGQTLAILQQESNQSKRVAESRASVEQERLNWDEAQREYARMNELFAKGFVARKELEGAQKGQDNAKIRYDLAKRQLLLTLSGNQALYERYLKRDLSHQEPDEFSIHAPVSGTVIEVKVSVGEIVASGTSTVTGGTTLMRIADFSKMWVKTKINEVNIGDLTEGQAAEVRLDAIANRLYHGKVAKISPQGEKVNNVVTYEVTIDLADSDPRLMPAMTANVDIVTRTAKEVLFLPLAAMTYANGKEVVTIKTAEGERVTRPVKVRFKNETVAVIDEGVREGDQVFLPKSDSQDERKR